MDILKPKLRILSIICMIGMVQPATAVILFGLDNTANQTDPGTGVPFDSVGKISVGGVISGSAIHLGSGYMLTANHVGIHPDVTFDGSTFYERDVSYIPTQVAPGVDMKVFKLTTTPTVGAVNIYGGISEEVAPATHVGWGRGRLGTVPVESAAVTWGDASTNEKRWGLNTPTYVEMVSGGGYSYEAIVTVLGSATAISPGLGSNESAATLYDSGSGLFQSIGGTWYLIGLATAVDTGGTSNFGEDIVSGAGKGDANYFVRVGTYQSDIIALIPEPGVWLMAMLGGAGWVMRRKRS